MFSERYAAICDKEKNNFTEKDFSEFTSKIVQMILLENKQKRISNIDAWNEILDIFIFKFSSGEKNIKKIVEEGNHKNNYQKDEKDEEELILINNKVQDETIITDAKIVIDKTIIETKPKHKRYRPKKNSSPVNKKSPLNTDANIFVPINTNTNTNTVQSQSQSQSQGQSSISEIDKYIWKSFHGKSPSPKNEINIVKTSNNVYDGTINGSWRKT